MLLDFSQILRVKSFLVSSCWLLNRFRGQGPLIEMWTHRIVGAVQITNQWNFPDLILSIRITNSIRFYSFRVTLCIIIFLHGIRLLDFAFSNKMILFSNVKVGVIRGVFSSRLICFKWYFNLTIKVSVIILFCSYLGSYFLCCWLIATNWRLI